METLYRNKRQRAPDLKELKSFCQIRTLLSQKRTVKSARDIFELAKKLANVEYLRKTNTGSGSGSMGHAFTSQYIRLVNSSTTLDAVRGGRIPSLNALGSPSMSTVKGQVPKAISSIGMRSDSTLELRLSRIRLTVSGLWNLFKELQTLVRPSRSTKYYRLGYPLPYPWYFYGMKGPTVVPAKRARNSKF